MFWQESHGLYVCHGKPSVEIKLSPLQGQSVTDVSLQNVSVVPVL